MRSPRHIPALTSVRGIAAWFVVLFHFREALPQGVPAEVYGLVTRGYLAVDLFFQLSGFVIALSYADGFRSLGSIQIRRFLMLRLARIYPLHIFMLSLFLLNPLAIWLFSAQASPGPRYDPTYFLLSVFLIQNWGFTSGLAWNVPAWSISTELFAYIIFPLLATSMHRLLRGAASALAGVAVLLFALAVAAHAAGLDDLGGGIPSFGVVRCAIEFAIGMLLCQLRSLRPVARSGEGNIAGLGAAACCAAHVLLPLPDYVAMPACFALLIWSLSDESALLSRCLRSRPLEALGEVSYSTYLTHYFFKDWANFLFVRPGVPEFLPILAYLAATFAASVLLYRWVELPGRRIGRALASNAARRGGWVAGNAAP